MAAQPAQAQRTVTGKVTSEEGESLIGVNILIKGTSTGTITDIDGNYSLNVPSEESVLVFSYTGFGSQEVQVGNQSVINVTLSEGSELLEEVVVVGYGTQRRGDVTAAISSVDGEDIQQLPVSSVEGALQGRAAGVQINNTSGQPGAGINVRVRGSTSITASNQPLYVVDGIPMLSENNSNLFTGGYSFNSLADIDPSDIASIEVLKDASAAAIYGSRGANGVILITTKRGQAGRGQVELDAYYGWQGPTNVIEMMNSREFIEMMNEAAANDGFGENYFNDLIGDPNDPNLQNTDWYGEILRDDAPIQNYSLSASGGNDKMTYYVGGTYFDQEGIQRGTAFTRYSGRANLDFSVSNKFKVGSNVMLSRTLAESTIGDNSLYGVMINALAADPTMPVFEDDGSYAHPFDYFSWWALENPRKATDVYERLTTTNRALGTIYGEYSFLPNLKLRSSFSVDYQFLKDNLFYPSITQQAMDSGVDGEGQYSSAETSTWLNENTLTYNTTINGVHNLTALAGITFQETTRDFVDIFGQNFPNDDLGVLDLAADITSASTNGTAWGLLSYLGRVNYNYANKYYLTASVRADGSSRFGEDRRFGVFPSVSASWRLSAEPFLAGANWLDDLKLRASWGLTGNQDGINNFAARPLWASNAAYDGAGGTAPSRMGNADLGWESTAQWDIGLDARFVNGRVGFSFDYFDKRTTDLLLNSNVPGYTGFTTVTRNIGEVRNRGIEFALDAVIFDNPGGFQWDVNFNIATIDNEVTKLEQNPEIFNNYILQEGAPLGTFFLIHWEGVDPETGNSVFEDLNDDGIINTDDAQAILDRTVWPDFFGGMTNTFRFGGFDLSVFLQYSVGNYVWNHSRYAQEQVGWSFNFGGGFFLPYGNNTQRVVDGRWQQPGDDTDIPRATLGLAIDENGDIVRQPQNWQEDSDQWLEDASYLRLKTLDFGYNLPSRWIRNIGMSRLRLYFRAQNLLTFTDYLGVDPEVGSNTNTTLFPGEDFGGLGQARAFIFGVKAGF